jgi:alkyl hydroperoxide reductase subunit AhpC
MPDVAVDTDKGMFSLHEWKKRGTKVIGVSVDGVDDHLKWKSDIESYGNHKPDFPIIADTTLIVSKAFDMLPSEAYLPDGRTPNDTATVRSVFIIGPDKKLKLAMTYPMTVGRNFAKVLRALDALQLLSSQGIATPADWQVRQDVIIPAEINDEEAREKFGAFEKVLPYLRKIRLA